MPLCDRAWPLIVDGKSAGQVTSAAWSPGFQTNVAIGMVNLELLDEGGKLNVDTASGIRTATVREKFFN